MKLTDLKINGMIEPIGYDFTDLRVAWKVVDVQGKNNQMSVSNYQITLIFLKF